MSDNPRQYQGRVTLVGARGGVLADVVLSVDDSANVRTWGGRATSDDLAALALDRKNVTVCLPDGATGEAWIPNARIEPETPGVVVRVQGAGAVPPWWPRSTRMGR